MAYSSRSSITWRDQDYDVSPGENSQFRGCAQLLHRGGQSGAVWRQPARELDVRLTGIASGRERAKWLRSREIQLALYEAVSALVTWPPPRQKWVRSVIGTVIPMRSVYDTVCLCHTVYGQDHRGQHSPRDSPAFSTDGSFISYVFNQVPPDQRKKEKQEDKNRDTALFIWKYKCRKITRKKGIT